MGLLIEVDEAYFEMLFEKVLLTNYSDITCKKRKNILFFLLMNHTMLL